MRACYSSKHRKLRSQAWLAASALLLMTELCASRAAAGSDVAEEGRYFLSLRPSIGLGAGDIGFGGRVGAAGEYWFSNTFGAGLAGAAFGQGQIFGPDSSAWAIAPLVAFRDASRGEYFFGEIGAGYARANLRQSSGLCLGLFSECPPQTRIHYSGYMFDIAAGWVAHPGGVLEIGPVARIDVVVDPSGRADNDFIATLNLELGVAFMGR